MNRSENERVHSICRTGYARALKMTAALPATAELPLESKLAFLRQPTSFSEPTYRVETIETHMSWVFLTGGYAYKLKKPVCYDILDFRTIEARRFYCEEEIRLNRRLAPQVYLGTVALVIDPAGHLQLGNGGSVTDWLVKMHRLSAHHMLDYALKRRAGREEDAVRIATLLNNFYSTCEPLAITADEYPRRLENELQRNLTALSRPAYHLPADRIHKLYVGQHAILQQLSDFLQERVRSGKIVEGHGDLRPEHVCLGSEVAIIDRLEFSRELRIVDSIDEVAHLALECERLGAADFAAVLLRAYRNISRDAPHPALVHAYQSFRACMRAKVAIWHLDEEKFRYSAEWPRRAMEYLQLAESHLETGAKCLRADS